MASKAYEVEQKYVIQAEDLAEIERRLNELQPERRPAVTQVDTYFAHPQRDFGQTDEALRLRQVGEANFVTYKGPKIDATTKTRREIELPLPEGELARWAELLTALSFRSEAAVRKQRRTGTLRRGAWEVEIVLDDVDRVGTFCELELQAEETTLEAAKRCLAEVAAELQLSAVERKSYLELLLERS